MKYPHRSASVSTEVVGDGLAVFDREQGQSYVLNATSALVFQHCDGQTSSQQMTEFLRRRFNVPPAEAEKLMRLALDELQTANLLQPGFAQMPPPAATLTRRQALTAFVTAGLSLALMPMVARVAAADDKRGDHGGGEYDDDDNDDHEGDGGHKLIPLLECVDNNGDGTYTAHFGYLNQSDRTITLGVGPKNKFSPAPRDRGQPTVFLPGEHLNVFSVLFDGATIQWQLKANGDRRHRVEANAMSERCMTTLPPTTLPPTTTTLFPPPPPPPPPA